MKPAERTLSYVIYPKDYVPGVGYRKARTLVGALRECRKLGVGAEVTRYYYTRNKRGSHSWCDSRDWIYNGG